MGFPDGSAGKEYTCDAGDAGLSMDMNLSKLQEMVEDRVAWPAAVHGATKSQRDILTEQQLFSLRSCEYKMMSVL